MYLNIIIAYRLKLLNKTIFKAEHQIKYKISTSSYIEIESTILAGDDN